MYYNPRRCTVLTFWGQRMFWCSPARVKSSLYIISGMNFQFSYYNHWFLLLYTDDITAIIIFVNFFSIIVIYTFKLIDKYPSEDKLILFSAS